MNPSWLSDVFGATQWAQIPDDGESKQPSFNGHIIGGDSKESNLIPLPVFDNRTSIGLRSFIESLFDSRPFKPHFFVLR